MGLFGFFMSVIGLGAMAKDAIERSSIDTESRAKAIARDDKIYYGFCSRPYATKTKRQLLMRRNDNGHVCYYYLDNGELYWDKTAEGYKLETDYNRFIAKQNGCAFYETAEYKHPLHGTSRIPSTV